MKVVSGKELGGWGFLPILGFNFWREDFPVPRPILPFVKDDFFLDFILIIPEKKEELPDLFSPKVTLLSQEISSTDFQEFEERLGHPLLGAHLPMKLW